MTATGTGGPLTPENVPETSETPNAAAIEALRQDHETLGLEALRRVYEYCVYWAGVNRKSSEINTEHGLEALASRGEATADTFDIVAKRIAFEIVETATRSAAARREAIAEGAERAATHAEQWCTPPGVPDVSAMIQDRVIGRDPETVQEWLRRFAQRIREGTS